MGQVCSLIGAIFLSSVAFAQSGVVYQVRAASVSMEDSHTEHIEGFDPSETQTTAPMSVVEPPIQQLMTNKPLNVKYDRLTNMTSNLKSKLNLAKKKLDHIFASREFYEAMLNHKYQGKKQFVQNDGLTNEQIYDRIQLGREKFKQQIDRMMNLELNAYYENSNTVGYTYTNSRVIHVNRKFYDNYIAAQIARNLVHEWLHKVGFKHDVQATSRRPYSVPYGVGSIVEKLARKI